MKKQKTFDEITSFYFKQIESAIQNEDWNKYEQILYELYFQLTELERKIMQVAA